MLERFHISSGSVVLSGHQVMVVILADGLDVVACPLVNAEEAIHRADCSLEWHELVDAGLTRLDVRCRAIPCRRKTLSLKALGCVSEATRSRLEVMAQREQRLRLQEVPRTHFPRKKPIHVGQKHEAWLDGWSMKSRREAELRID